jgi:hypothetical protein
VWTEPHSAEMVEQCVTEYCTAISEKRGGLLIAVCRGKVRPSILSFASRLLL